MAYDYEERVVSMLIGDQEYEDECSTISEFKQLSNAAALAEEKLVVGWIFCRKSGIYQHHYEQQQLIHHKIITLLKHIASDWCVGYHRFAQFWGVVRVEGSHHYLSTSYQPFCVPNLRKGLGWYRRACVNKVYKVDMKLEEEEEEMYVGGVGRAYRNRQPESTPDLRLYSINEFPLRNKAASCGFRGYMTIPLFDLHKKECYGVLELLSHHPIITDQKCMLSFLDQGLQISGLKSTHISCFTTRDVLDRFEQPDDEITKILELTIKAVPRLSLAQVWIPCKQCLNTSCLETRSFISDGNKVVGWDPCDEIYDNDDMLCYLQACEFHNLQIYLTCSLRNMSDLSISKYPLAHYTKKARMSHCFSICLRSLNKSNDPLVIIQFFLQLKNREDVCGDSSLLLLLRIIKMKLKSYEFVSMEQLPKELVVESRQPNTIECEYIDKLNVMNSYEEKFSELGFTTYLETSCFQRPLEDSRGGWVFGLPVGAKKIQNNVQNNFLMMPSLIKEKIEQFFKNITVRYGGKYWIIQFWAPKTVEGRYCLETLDQPYVVGCLAKCLASFRKECTKRLYFMDDDAKEEELGPPGRVFRNEYPEFTSNLFLYTTKEFCMRNYALHCNLEEYFVLPVFEKQEHKCVGVLEFMGFSPYDLYAKDIEGALEIATLRSSHIDLRPRFIAIAPKAPNIPANIVKALTEVKSAFSLISKIPQLCLAKVWVPCEKGASINSNVRYMELALTSEVIWQHNETNRVHWINYVKPKRGMMGRGMMGMVLESENKSCFYRNLSEFSIADQPLALVERQERLEVCFAICLQSSHTGDLLYVLEFFLDPGLNYLRSFFNYLLAIMKQELKSFKYSFGKQLGEELVVEVIEFYETNTLASSELGQLDVFPIRFKSVQYGQMKHLKDEDMFVHCVSNAIQTEQCNNVASDPNKTDREKKKIGFHLSLEDLMSQSGKKLKDVAKEFKAGPSTMKVNPSKENGQHSQKDMQPSSSSNLSLLKTSLHPIMPRTNTESKLHRVVQEEAENVIIKVKHKEDIIKFELCLKLGLPKLFEEVATRLKLEMGTFKLKYLDEDDDEVLLTCDADLQCCLKSQITMGKAYIQLFVQ